VSKEIRIGVTGMSTAGAVADPYAGVNLAAALNPNFVDGMDHWTDANAHMSATDTLPIEFTPDPTITTGSVTHTTYDPTSYSTALQDKVAIPEDMRAFLPCDFKVSYWRLQVGGAEGVFEYPRPAIYWYDAAGTLLQTSRRGGVWIASDIHAWQLDSYTVTIPASVYYLALGIDFWPDPAFDTYCTATKLERVGVGLGSGAPTAPAFSISRDSAGILLAVRDNAAPQFNVGRDADGLTISVPR